MSAAADGSGARPPAPGDARQLLELFRVHGDTWSLGAHAHLAAVNAPDFVVDDGDEPAITFTEAKRLEALLAPAHPDHHHAQNLSTLGELRRTWMNHGYLAREAGWVLLWNRNPWLNGGHGISGAVTPAGAVPTSVADLFPFVRAVRDHGLRIVTCTPDEQPLPTDIGRFLIGATPAVDQVDRFAPITADDTSYRWEPADGAALDAAEVAAIVDGARRAEVDLLVAPTGTGGPAHAEVWGSALAAAPGRVAWVVNGSGSVEIDGQQHHRAALISRSDDEPRWKELATPGVARRSPLLRSVARDWGLSPTVDATGLEASDAAITEETEIDSALTIVETAICRLALLVGTHEPDRAAEVEMLARAGPTHVVRLTAGEEVIAKGSIETDAARVARETGAAVLVANSTAVARHQRSMPPGTVDQPVGAALWRDRGSVAPWISARSRRPSDVMVPQYGAWSTPLESSDLRRGDLLFFLRNPTNSRAFGGLNSAIAGWDQTSMVHVALVTEPGATFADTKVVDSYEVMGVRPLHELGKSYGLHVDAPGPDLVAKDAQRTLFAPSFVSRLVEPAHAVGLVEATEDVARVGAPYPGTHVLYAALLLRPRLAGVDPKIVNAWAHLLALAAEKQGDPALMCGEMLLVAAERYNAHRGTAPALDLGLDQPVELPPGAGPYEQLGRSWLGSPWASGDPNNALKRDLTLAIEGRAYFPVRDVRHAVEHIRNYLSESADWPTTLVQPELIDGVAAGLVRPGDPGGVLAAEDWPGQLAGLAPRDSRPARLGTVSDILRSPHLAHLGHLHHWWS